MNDREANDLRHSAKEALERTEYCERPPVVRQSCSKNHEQSTDLGPQPSWKTIEASVCLREGSPYRAIPSVSLDERHSEDTAEALQQDTIVHARGRMRGGDTPFYRLRNNQSCAPGHCTEIRISSISGFHIVKVLTRQQE